MTLFVRVLVALFMVGQFAGAVPSPLASSHAFAVALALHDHNHRMPRQSGAVDTGHHCNQDRDQADHCCALHAFFAGVLPAIVAVETIDILTQRVAPDLEDLSFGVASDRLDRPPRPVL